MLLDAGSAERFQVVGNGQQGGLGGRRIRSQPTGSGGIRSDETGSPDVKIKACSSKAITFMLMMLRSGSEPFMNVICGNEWNYFIVNIFY